MAIGILNYMILPTKRLMFFVCLLGFASVQNGDAQQQIAQDTYAIFETSCLICHGPDGAYRETLLMEHNALIENGAVVPGSPDASELYNRLLNTDTAKRMPLGQPQLSLQAIDTIRNWILAGAPDWTTPATTDAEFISPAEILTTIETHLMSLAPFDRAFARYFTLTHIHNAGEPPAVLDAYRKGLSKLVNSLSWGATIINPQPIDSQKTILYIDLRHYEWDVNDGWGQIETAYPYHIPFDAPSQKVLRDQLGRLQTEMKCNIPSIHADWFLAKVSLPPLYHDLLSLPLTDKELETRLGVDVERNRRDAPGVRVWRAGFNNSGVSNSNRVVERHAFRDGAYWKSYDFAGSVGTQNIFNHPLSFTHDGGEVIFNLPNGLQGYYVTNASGFRLDDAPINIVSNPAASNPTVRNGLSCFGCHTEGIKTFEDQVRSVIVSNANPTYDKAQALRLYVEKSEMDALVQEDMERYKGALEATGGAVGDIEPISRFHEAFQAEVAAAYAAAVVGLETEVFLEKIRENIGLQNAGLLVLDSPNGNMKRDAWTSNFPAIIYALDFPDEQVDSPSQPEQPPGTVVRIPDTNLRSAIAEALGKTPSALITVEEIERLEGLGAEKRGIRDLTGLQSAINLKWLNLTSNQISDLSPLAGLIKLRNISLRFNQSLSDISPLKGLTNLTYLSFTEGQVSDLSPLAGLINLKYIDAWGNPVSDLSSLAGLTKLESLTITKGHISDLTPLAGLTGLKALNLSRNGISDISVLARLTELNRIDLSHNEISDLSPFAGLANLKWLRLFGNEISDVSPLAGLTNLKWLGVAYNEISDISPLDGLREQVKLVWFDNPGFPKGGPKIEGPWLWLLLPDTRLDSSTDLLAEASEGEVTDIGVATHGAAEGQSVADEVWIVRRLSPESRNIEQMLGGRIDNAIIYGTVSLHSPREQETTMYVGSHDDLKVWLNGALIYESFGYHESYDYMDFLPVTLRQGRNVLLVAVQARLNGFFGFEPGTEYTVANTGVGYTFSKMPIHRDDIFTLDIRAENVYDLAGWQFDIAFDPNILEAIDVSEGSFLKAGGGTTFFQAETIDNAAGKITGLSAVRLSTQGVSGTGVLVQAKFKAKSASETELELHNFELAAITGGNIPAGPHQVRITVEGGLAIGDVNRDGQVSSLDLVLVAQQLGNRVTQGSPVDVNGDGVVSMLDLIIVAQAIGNATASAAPVVETEGIDPAMIEAWIAQARLEDDGSLTFKQGIENLERLLASLIPDKTALLHNYPNPFNPETWIPYQLAESAEVTLTIYDMNGQLVRRLALGYQAAGLYRSPSRAVYWDGRNQLGESVASGPYFYTMTAGEFTATRKMIILK